MPALAKLIPIDKFYDHGDSIEAVTPQGAKLYDDYKAVARASGPSLSRAIRSR